MLIEIITDKAYVLSGATNIGLIINKQQGSGVMIDSGLDDSAARKVLRLAREELSVEIFGVITTHAHADHHGGHHFLQKKGIQVYAPSFEEAGVRYPVLEPYAMFGGAHPPEYLHNKFLKAQAAEVNKIIDEGHHMMHDIEFEVLPLYGHTEQHIGILVKSSSSESQVLFASDAIFKAEVLTKHNHLPFNVNIAETLASLNKIEQDLTGCNYFVPGHGQLISSQELPTTIANYKSVIEDNLNLLRNLLERPLSRETLVAEVLTQRACEKLSNLGLYYLMHNTILAYLSYLENAGEIEAEINKGQIIYYQRPSQL